MPDRVEGQYVKSQQFCAGEAFEMVDDAKLHQFMGQNALRPRRARASKQRDPTMLNLENLGMSQIEPWRRPLAVIAVPASDRPVVASPIETLPAS